MHPIEPDETRLENESWFDMMNRISPELKKRDEELKANARLIAAAPEMLEALKEVSRLPVAGSYPDGPCLEWDDMDMVKKAIAKATGEAVSK